jgi:hypothetical protein
VRSCNPTDADIAAALADLDALPDKGPCVFTDISRGSQLDDLIAVLRPRPWLGLIRPRVLDEMEARRAARSCRIPPAFEQSVQRTFNTHNDRSRAKDRDEESLIFTSHTIGGETYWAMAAYRPR